MGMIKRLVDLKDNQGVMRYFKNTSWMFAEKILRIIVGVFVGVWVARYLGPERFGLFNYTQSFVALFSAIATLGLDGIVIRELVKDASQRNKLLGTSFILKLAGAFFVILFVIISMLFQSNDYLTNSLVLIISFSTIFQSFNVIDFYFRSQVLSKYVVYANVFSLAFSSVIKIILIFNNAQLISFAYVVFFESFILSAGFVYFYYHKNLSVMSWTFEASLAKKLLKDSWPLIISGLAVILQARIDQIMLKQMIGNEEVGQYSVALRLVEMLDFFSGVLIQSIMPAIVNAKEQSEYLYQHRIYTMYKFMMLSFLLIFIFNLLFGEWIVLFLYGSEYLVAATLFPLFSIRTVFTNYGLARGLFITSNNLFKYSMYFVICGAIINISLNYFLIPDYKSKGALVATIVTYMFTIFILNFIFKETRSNGMLMLKSLVTFPGFKLKDLR